MVEYSTERRYNNEKHRKKRTTLTTETIKKMIYL